MSNLEDNVIQSAITSHYVYSKAHFDNAKDTRDLIEAARMTSESLELAIRSKLEGRVEQLVSEYLEDALKDNNEVHIRIGGKFFRVSGSSEVDNENV